MSVDWLIERMGQWEDRTAIVWRGTSQTYGELRGRYEFWRNELRIAGIATGQVVALRGDFSPNSCGVLLALVDLGVVAVPLSPTVGAQAGKFMDIAEVQHVVSLDETDRPQVEARQVSVTNPLTRRLADTGHPGLVLFSSGSTGESKAALHDFTALLVKFMVERHRKTTIAFLLPDHIGGINTLLYTLSNGGTIVALANRDADEVCRAIEAHQVQILPTSPTFLNMLLISEAYARHNLSSLELVTYGTEVMPESTLRRLNTALPNVRLLQTYGLSEVGILRSKSKSSDSLWVKVGGEGFETRVVDGILHIRARSAMLGYLNAPSPFDDEGWLNTQDEVEVDGEYIRILGRRSEIINVGGQKVFPAEVESVLIDMENVREASVFGEKNALTGSIVAARFNLLSPENPREFRKRVRRHCRDRLSDFKIPVKIEITDVDQVGSRFKKMRRQASS